jgi:hypothetical protein
MDNDTLVSVCVIGGCVFLFFIIYIATSCVLYERTDTLNSNQRVILQTAFNATLDESAPVAGEHYSTRHLVQFDGNLRQVYGLCEISPETKESVSIEIHKIRSGNAISLLHAPITITSSTANTQLHNFSASINAQSSLLDAGDVVEITATSTSIDVRGLLISAQIWAPQEVSESKKNG